MEIIGGLVGYLMAIYLLGLVIALTIFFLGATLSYCQSGQDSAQQTQILGAAILWPRTLWLLMRIPKYWSLAQWQTHQKFRQRRFSEKEAKVLKGRQVVVVREICTDVGGRENIRIPVGATGWIEDIEGTKKERFELKIKWDNPLYQCRPYQMGYGSYGWDKSFFQEGYLALTNR